LLLVGFIRSHHLMTFPMTRKGTTSESANDPQSTTPGQFTATNGIVMEKAGVTSLNRGLEQIHEKYVVQVDSKWFWYPCGGKATQANGLAGNIMATAPPGNMRSNLRNNMQANPKFFDFGQGFGVKPVVWRAGAVVPIEITGSFHPGTIRVAICYDSCDRLDQFEKYILGYWWVEGFINQHTLTVNVELPLRPCDRCVLQYLHEAADARSYVTCADVMLSPSAPTVPVYSAGQHNCNGHPLCNCKEGVAARYGLGGRCPVGLAKRGYTPRAGSYLEAANVLGHNQFCGYCVSNGCPTTCGGLASSSAFGQPVMNPRRSHTNRLDSMQLKVACGDGQCACPGCLGDLSAQVNDDRPRNRNFGNNFLSASGSGEVQPFAPIAPSYPSPASPSSSSSSSGSCTQHGLDYCRSRKLACFVKSGRQVCLAMTEASSPLPPPPSPPSGLDSWSAASATSTANSTQNCPQFVLDYCKGVKMVCARVQTFQASQPQWGCVDTPSSETTESTDTAMNLPSPTLPQLAYSSARRDTCPSGFENGSSSVLLILVASFVL